MTSVNVYEDDNRIEQRPLDQRRLIQELGAMPAMFRAEYFGYDVEALIEFLKVVEGKFLAKDPYGNICTVSEMISRLERDPSGTGTQHFEGD